MEGPAFESEFADEVAQLAVEVNQFVSSLPPPLDRVGAKLCNGVVNHLAFQIFLPLWLGEAWKLSRGTSLKAAAGNVYGSLYFVIQDRAVDCGDRESLNLLPLSTMFFAENLRLYSERMEGNPLFWKWLQRYLAEYCQAVTEEAVQRHGKLSSFEPGDKDLLGRKISPLKCSIRVMAHLAGRSEVAETLCDAVQIQETGRQLADDLEDWREDLKAGNFTYPLVAAARRLGVSDPQALPMEDVAMALFTTGLAEEILDDSDRKYGLARDLVRSESEHWAEYITHRMEKNQISKRRLIGGKIGRLFGIHGQ